MKLCKDCKHFVTIIGCELCDHPSVKHSPVDGTPISQCYFVRDETIGKCGVQGKLFEQAPPAPPLNPIEYAPAPTQSLSFWQRLFDRLA